MGLDDAFSCAVVLRQEVEPRLDAIENEADARLQLINRFLTEVLGWHFSEIKAEPHSESGYTDYLLHINGRPSLVVEAKRTGQALLDTKRPLCSTYKVGGPALASAASGPRQAATYCLDHGVDFAVVTTGLVWIAFLPFPGGGKSYKEGNAIVFPGLQSCIESFAQFYDLFSRNGISDRLYKVIFSKAEGLSASEFEPMMAVNRQSDVRMLKRSSLAADLDPVFREFFGAMSGDTDQDMLLKCFVETRESRHADVSLEKIIRNISSGVETLATGTGTQLVQEIEAAVETGHGDTVIIVGNKGAGKSTFVERFFKLVLDSSLRARCLVIRVDLLQATGDAGAIAAWLTEKVRVAIESNLYKNGIPTYDELQGLFWHEYTRWREGQFRHLYETDKTGFKIKFGEYVHERINIDAHSYVLRLLEDAVRNRKLLPCLIFDNADHYEERFQEAVFQWSQSIRREVPFSFVVMPITDRTIWRLSKAGPFQTYRSKLFYLPVPSAKEVLERRVAYLMGKTNESTDVKSYFLGKGIRLNVENIAAFAACVEEKFIKEDFISRRISWLSNHDIRRSLLLSQQIITSPFFTIDDLVSAYMKRAFDTPIFVGYQKFMQALVLGDYNCFQQENNSFILNMFLTSPQFPSTPFLRLGLLKLLIDKAGDESGVGSYLSVGQIISYFEAMQVSDDAVREALKVLLDYRLVEPFDASSDRFDSESRVAITHSGRMHYEMATTDQIYLAQMSFCTPLRSMSVVDRLRGVKAGRMGVSEWEQVRRDFMIYCFAQDRIFVRLPKDEMYNGQRQLRSDLRGRWIGNRNSSNVGDAHDDDVPPEIISPDARAKSHLVATVRWFDGDKGYGFLDGDEDIIVRKAILREAGIDGIAAGDVLTCDVGPGQKGRSQVIWVHSVETNVGKNDQDAEGFLDGKVEFYNKDKGYGFVRVPSVNRDVYLSAKVLKQCGIEDLSAGSNVNVLIGPEVPGRGRAATSVRMGR